MLPRCSFFPLYLDDAFKQRFQDYVAKGNDNDEMWLEVDGRPLKWCVSRRLPVPTPPGGAHGLIRGGVGGGGGGRSWPARPLVLARHVPIGAQFDLFGQQDVLPWAIQVHFRQFPETLVRYGGLEALQLHFYAMVKQSEYVRTGATKKIMNMSKNEQTQLWEGCRTRTPDCRGPAAPLSRR